MNPHRLLKKLIIITLASLLHIGISIVLYEPRQWISVLPVITALLNSWILLRYFSYTIQHIIAHRIGKRHAVNHHFVINIILGIIINALMIYSLFVMMIAHTVVIIERLN